MRGNLPERVLHYKLPPGPLETIKGGIMITITSFALKYFGEPRTAGASSLTLISLFSCFGLALSLGMSAFGFDLNVG